MTKICPKCKENLHPTMPGVYGCGTPVRRLRDGSLFETKKCLRRQLAQAKAVIDTFGRWVGANTLALRDDPEPGNTVQAAWDDAAEAAKENDNG